MWFLRFAIIGLIVIFYSVIAMGLSGFNVTVIPGIYIGIPLGGGIIMFILSVVLFIKGIPWF